MSVEAVTRIVEHPADDMQPVWADGGDFNYTQPGWSADGRRLTAFRWVEDAVGEIGHIVLLDASP